MTRRLTFILTGLIFFTPASVHAEIVKQCITHIHQVLDKTQGFPEDGSTIVVLDWDRTISRSEGGNNFRELGEQGTQKTITAFQNKNYKTMILTARLGGFGFSEECRGDLTVQEIEKAAENEINKMLTILPQWPDNGPLIDERLESLKNPDLDVCLLKGKQIVFAGGTTWKADAIKLLIQEGRFVTKPQNIIVVDNDIKNIDDFSMTFEGRDENVYLFHYPQTEPGTNKSNAPDKACSENKL